jgi:hypothetical protein
MAPAIADRRPKYVTKSCYVPMSESGQTLPMDSAPVPPDVRCCAKSDHSRRECEMTRRAMYGRRPRCLVPFSWSSPVPNAGQWLGSTPAGCEVCRESLQDRRQDALKIG